MNPELAKIIVQEYENQGLSPRAIISNPDFAKMRFDQKVETLKAIRSELAKPLSASDKAERIATDVYTGAAKGLLSVGTAAGVGMLGHGLSRALSAGSPFSLGETFLSMAKVAPTVAKYAAGIGLAAGAAAGLYKGVVLNANNDFIIKTMGDTKMSPEQAAVRVLLKQHQNKIKQDFLNRIETMQNSIGVKVPNVVFPEEMINKGEQ